MDKDRNEMSRRILDFTLEIIYLLSGKEYTIVKKTLGDCTTPIIRESGGWSSSQIPITEPPPHSRIHEKMILELIYKMTEMLTGEVSGCHCLFLHGGVGVSRRTQGSVRGGHDGELPAAYITRCVPFYILRFPVQRMGRLSRGAVIGS
ncbi:oocyte zinc finger protein XlCOF29-like [Rhinoderma darwinii]|uniref:oocyte zinc finger protein XlCOF29-like n=1 Tax=Rhinoderma darwinii TaxID=43563 RepID=UPI003F6675E4